jgi:PAS domain S-box-containing protein
VRQYLLPGGLRTFADGGAAAQPTMKTPSTPIALREQAERLLRHRGASIAHPEDHELQVHQLELMMQNESLRELQIELSITRERYRELFDHAPLPYLVLQRDSAIVRANQAAATMLNLGRHRLAGRKLSTFIDPSCCERFALHMRATLASDDVNSVELSLRLASGPREVRLQSSRSPVDPLEWRVAVIDLTRVRELEGQLERLATLGTRGTSLGGARLPASVAEASREPRRRMKSA